MIAVTIPAAGTALDPQAPAAVIAAASILYGLLAALPVCIGVAILKYRLYDIDRIISRTLAYAIVTGLLVGVYAGLVLLTTQVFRVHTPVAVAASTLAAAALFNPVRRRVQKAVDRRFNRARYDADKTITAFAAHLRDAVDLDAVRADLLGVVHAALEAGPRIGVDQPPPRRAAYRSAAVGLAGGCFRESGSGLTIDLGCRLLEQGARGITVGFIELAGPENLNLRFA